MARTYVNSSKIDKFLYSHISRLSFLHLENYFFQTLHKNHANVLLLQTANIYSNKDIQLESSNVKLNSNDIEIEKSFSYHQLKSKRRQKLLPRRFSFNVKNTVNLAKPDTRTPLQSFEAILKKLHKVYKRDEIKQFCASCNYDIAIPQTTSNQVFLGSSFIKALIRKFKRIPEFSYGQPDKNQKVLQSLGFNYEEIFNVLKNENDDPNNIDFYAHQSQTPKIYQNAHLPKDCKSNDTVKLNNKKVNLNRKQINSNNSLITKKYKLIKSI